MVLHYSYNPPKNPIPYLFLTKRHAYVRSILKNSQILDLGCNRYKITTRAIGLDFDLSVKPDIRGTVFNLPFMNESFDSVTALELIEHFRLHYQHLFLNEVYRILKPEGQFIVSTPNISEKTRKLHDILFYISHTLYAPKDVRSHVGELTNRQLKQKILNHNFKIISEKAFSLFNYVVECEKN